MADAYGDAAPVRRRLQWTWFTYYQNRFSAYDYTFDPQPDPAGLDQKYNDVKYWKAQCAFRGERTTGDLVALIVRFTESENADRMHPRVAVAQFQMSREWVRRTWGQDEISDDEDETDDEEYEYADEEDEYADEEDEYDNEEDYDEPIQANHGFNGGLAGSNLNNVYENFNDVFEDDEEDYYHGDDDRDHNDGYYEGSGNMDVDFGDGNIRFDIHIRLRD